MSVLKIVEMEGGERLFRWERVGVSGGFVEWKCEKTLALELGYNDKLESIHSDWERDACMLLDMLREYVKRGVELLDWECRGGLRSVGEVISEIDWELNVSWDGWLE